MKRDLIIKEQGLQAVEFIEKYTNIEAENTLICKTNDLFNIEAINYGSYSTIINLNKINDINGINRFFTETNFKLSEKSLFIGCLETQLQRKKRILKKYPFIIAQIYFSFDFIFKRVFPKLILTRWFYFFITAGRNRVLSKAEALGRLVFCGFDIVEVTEVKNLTYFVCAKTNNPIPDKKPYFGFFFKMNRVGKNNTKINVYKIRTMHPYAEYLQKYVYEQNNLKTGGKFKDDFRITSWGKFFRECWIDELPMIINLVKGQIKLVGVRPLSEQYLSLYSDELKQRRLVTTPGLIPPFYADLPTTLDDIIASEIKYLDLHEKKPLKTDINYFFRAVKNILFKKARTN